MLEGHAAARASRRIGAPEIEQLARHNLSIRDAAQRQPINSGLFLEHNREFHAIILQAAGSDRLTALLGTIIEQPIVLRTARRYDRDQVMRSFAEHEELILAFRRRDPDWAEAVMKAHIRRAFHAYRDAFLNALVRDGASEAAE